MRSVRFLWMVSLLVAALSAVVPGGPTPAGAAACTLAPTVGGDGRVATVERTVGGRRYLLRVPAGIPGTEATLVVSLHGFAAAPFDRTGPEAQERLSQLSAAADRYGFIVAYPEGSESPIPVPVWPWYRGWDALRPSSPDLDFLVDVVEDVSARWCVDDRHVHAEGLSMGAAMAQRVACGAADVFASVASHSATDVERDFMGHRSGDCAPSRPIAVSLYCGEGDASCAPVDPVLEDWTDRLRCPAPATPSVPFGSARHHLPCAASTAVWHRTWAGGDHLYPTDPAVLERYHAELVFLFAAHPRP